MERRTTKTLIREERKVEEFKESTFTTNIKPEYVVRKKELRKKLKDETQKCLVKNVYF